MPVLAVAAVSARMLAEAAALDGHDVVALDLFGDADTRLASRRWQPAGEVGAAELDGGRVLQALREVARDAAGNPVGWIAGAGFEGRPELLEAGAQLLPLIGTPADAVRRVRDPRVFFEVLAANGIAHPDVRADAPADPEGWLSKDARACGGWHIRHAASVPGEAQTGDPAHTSSSAMSTGPRHAMDAASHLAPHAPSATASRYFQRAMPGTPMSATFIANGERAVVFGLNELIVRPFGAHPHVYCGCVGPVAVPTALARRVGDIVQRLSAEFSLRGWCSLDFIRDGESIGVLEVNPRPPATLTLYAQRGLIDAQLRACLHGELPSAGAFDAAQVAGSEIVYARHPLQLGEAGARHLADRPMVHDRPLAGARFAAGDPVCSVSAVGHDAAQVKALLSAGRDALLHTLETTP